MAINIKLGCREPSEEGRRWRIGWMWRESIKVTTRQDKDRHIIQN